MCLAKKKIAATAHSTTIKRKENKEDEKKMTEKRMRKIKEVADLASQD